MKVLRRDLLGMASALGLGGCSLWPQAPDEPRQHLLDARPAVAVMPASDVVLAVSAPRAAAALDTTAMLYVQQAHALDHFAMHRWADTPARMIAPLLVRALDDTRAFRAVVQAGAGVQAALRLDTELVQMHQNFMARPSQVELVLRAQLIDMAARRVVATRTFEARQVAPSDDAPGGVVGANTALVLVLTQLAAWCAAPKAV